MLGTRRSAVRSFRHSPDGPPELDEMPIVGDGDSEPLRRAGLRRSRICVRSTPMPRRGMTSRPKPVAARRRSSVFDPWVRAAALDASDRLLRDPGAGRQLALRQPCAPPGMTHHPSCHRHDDHLQLLPGLMTLSSSYTAARDLTVPAGRAIVLPVSSRHHAVPVVGRAGIATAATMVVVIAAIRSANAGPPPEPPLALLGFVAVYSAPALLGVVGLRRAAGPPFAAAALAAFGLAFTSFSAVTMPYLIPALLLGVAAARTGGWTIARTFAALASTAMLVAAWFAVVTWREMTCLSTALRSGCGQIDDDAGRPCGAGPHGGGDRPRPRPRPARPHGLSSAAMAQLRTHANPNSG